MPLEIHSLVEGFFLFKFSSENDYQHILQNSWTIGGRPLILWQWHLGMLPAREMLKPVPNWVLFCELPIQYFGEDNQSIIISTLGVPLFIDKTTISRSQPPFARVYIEIDSTFSFPSVLILIKEDDSSFYQKVEYEWKLSICTTCHYFDYVAATCSCHLER